MYRFFLFINKIIFVLLFLVIEIFAFRYYSDSSSYNQAKLINVSNRLAGDIYAGIAGVRQYFTLGAENKRLTAEVAKLRGTLESYQKGDTTILADSLLDSLNYTYTQARVINNNITRNENYITLNKGERDGIEKDMAIISNGAIAGYVLNCSEKFSVAISILNTKFRTSGRILGTDYFGPLHWDARTYNEVMLSDIPKYATIELGDTIVTTEFSSIFPPGLMIGTVKSFEMVNGTNYEAVIELTANMGALNNVVLIKYEDLEEKFALENSVTEN